MRTEAVLQHVEALNPRPNVSCLIAVVQEKLKLSNTKGQNLICKRFERRFKRELLSGNLPCFKSAFGNKTLR